MSDIGGWRGTDPPTSEDAARSLSTVTIKATVLLWLAHQSPLNGWELAVRMKLPTITVVPRLAPLRRAGLIVQQGTRPGPSGRSQIAYVLTEVGAKLVAGPNRRAP